MNSLPKIVMSPEGPMAQPAGPDVLSELLKIYEDGLVAAGVPLRDWLQPGLDRNEVTRRLAEAGLGAPEELVVWFGWHNGFTESPDFPLSRRALPRFAFGNIDRVLLRYRQGVDFVNSLSFKNLNLDRSVYEWGAGEGWLRIVDDNYGCAVNCSDQRDQPPRLHYATDDFDMPGSEDLYRAVSLCTLVTWWIDGLRNGAYRWNADKQCWDEDVSRLPASQRAAHFS